MSYIDKRFVFRVFALVLVLLLFACGSTPEKKTGVADNGRAKPTVPAAAEASYKQVLAAVDTKDWLLAESLLVDMQTEYPDLLGVPATLGWVYWQQQKADEAETILLPLLDNPSLYKPDAYNTLAVIYRDQGKFKQAESLYLRSLGIWPSDVNLHINLGILYDLYLGEPRAALNHYRKANELSASKNKTLNGWIKDLERRL